jgi:hypothetical protein
MSKDIDTHASYTLKGFEKSGRIKYLSLAHELQPCISECAKTVSRRLHIMKTSEPSASTIFSMQLLFCNSARDFEAVSETNLIRNVPNTCDFKGANYVMIGAPQYLEY